MEKIIPSVVIFQIRTGCIHMGTVYGSGDVMPFCQIVGTGEADRKTVGTAQKIQCHNKIFTVPYDRVILIMNFRTVFRVEYKLRTAPSVQIKGTDHPDAVVICTENIEPVFPYKGMLQPESVHTGTDDTVVIQIPDLGMRNIRVQAVDLTDANGFQTKPLPFEEYGCRFGTAVHFLFPGN